MLLVVTRATSFKATWFLAVLLLVLVINITSEVILHEILLMSFYLAEYINCKFQYVGSATSFKQHFHIHKSDIKTKKDRRGTARHFNSICCHQINPNDYLKVQLIEQVFCDASTDI